MLMLFLRSKLNITFSKILSYYLQSLNGTSYNLGHNILELYNVLVQIQLTTSKAKRDISYTKLGNRVTSRVAERLKT